MRLVSSACALILFGLAVPRPAGACSCLSPPPPLVALVRSDLVCTGRVTRILDPGDDPSSSRTLRCTLSAVHMWKGARPSGDSLVVETSAGSASCGYPFRLGRDYLVYCAGRTGRPSTGLCTRTRPLEQAAEDLDAFRRAGNGVDPERIDLAVLNLYGGMLASPDSVERRAGRAGLAGMGVRAAPVACSRFPALFDGSSPGERRDIVYTLGAIGSGEPGCTELLRKAARDRDSGVRMAAVNFAANCGIPDAEVRTLEERAVRDSSPLVRAVALKGLVRRCRPGDGEIEAILFEAASDSAVLVRAMAVRALSSCAASQPDRRLALLTAALRDSAPDVRMAAARGLEFLGPEAESAIPELVRAATDSVPRVRVAAQDAWARIRGVTPAPVVRP